MHSCIYEGVVAHRRHQPVAHGFHYRLFMVYLDLEELPALQRSGGLIPSRKFATWSFLREDHLFGVEPIVDEVRELITAQTGTKPAGPIRLLTQLRHCGYYFSPLNLYFVFDGQDQQLEYVVAEVNNTPWKERHCYVLWSGNQVGSAGPLSFEHPKQFHVSPFMGMDMAYRWVVDPPGSELGVRLTNLQQGRELFEASLQLSRHELDKSTLRRMALRYPLVTGRISAAIYYQALQLWWKRCPFFPHPNKLTNPADSSLAPGTPDSTPSGT